MVIGNEIKVPTWADFADTSWYNAALSEYDISTAEQLAGLSALVASGINFNGKTLNLINDIDQNIEWILSASSRWFGGIFNGNGHKITGLKIATPRNVGLFSAMSAEPATAGISNLTVSGKIDIAGSKVSARMWVFLQAWYGALWELPYNLGQGGNTIFKSECATAVSTVWLGGLALERNSNYPHNGMADSSFRHNQCGNKLHVPGVGGKSAHMSADFWAWQE